jgi:hypothetical protein
LTSAEHSPTLLVGRFTVTTGVFDVLFHRRAASSAPHVVRVPPAFKPQSPAAGR